MKDFMKVIMDRFSILTIVLILSVGVMPACGQSNQSSNQANSSQPTSNQTQEIKIPSGIKNPTYDPDVNKETPLVIKIAADNKTYVRKSSGSKWEGEKSINYFDYTLLTDTNFIGEIKTRLEDKIPDRRLAYIQAETNVKFGKLAELFEKMAKSEAAPNKIRFIVNPLKEIEKSQQTDNGGYVLTLILPEKESPQKKVQAAEPDSPSPPTIRFPPGYKKSSEQMAAEEKAKRIELEKAEARKKIKVEKLSVEFGDAGKIKFNNQPNTPAEFSANLKKIFDERTAYDIFRPGTNESDNTVYLKISPNVDYGEAIKLIDEIYGLGAKWIYLDASQNK